MALRIAFVRPRLGMGGAERLVVDAARALRSRGHEVTLFAPDRAEVPQFEDARSPAFSWRSGPGWLPESVFGRLRAPMSVLRAFAAGRGARGFGPDVVFADVTSHIVPWLARSTNAPVIFYCHFPDALLTPEGARKGRPYRVYRKQLDRMEARGLEAAAAVLVNSSFTAARLADAFPGLRRPVSVLPPGVDTSRFEAGALDEGAEIRVVTVSRIDPRKNLGLALEAFAAARAAAPLATRTRLVLHIVGRYDGRWPECRQTLESLEEAAIRLEVAPAVRFHLSPEDAAVRDLLAGARAVLYTPRGEHFGYGPLEAMASARPVIAVNEGGPAETVIDGVCGFLCPATPTDFAAALLRCLLDPDLAKRLGVNGRERAVSRFSLERFGAALEAICLRAADRG